MTKRLVRSETNKVFVGVCGGLAEYFDVDPVLVRLAFVLLAFANGIGVIVYIVLAVVLPNASSTSDDTGQTVRENLERLQEEAGEAGRRVGASLSEGGPEAVRQRRTLFAIVLILVGLAFLTINLGGFVFWWLDWGTLWPLVLVIIGLGVLVNRFRRND